MSRQEKSYLRGNDARSPRSRSVSPLFGENVITCNKTDPDGNVINVSPVSAVIKRNEPDENQK